MRRCRCWKIEKIGCHHSSVDSSLPTILPPQLWVPGTPIMGSQICPIYDAWKEQKKTKRGRVLSIFNKKLYANHFLLAAADAMMSLLLLENWKNETLNLLCQTEASHHGALLYKDRSDRSNSPACRNEMLSCLVCNKFQAPLSFLR